MELVQASLAFSAELHHFLPVLLYSWWPLAPGVQGHTPSCSMTEQGERTGEGEGAAFGGAQPGSKEVEGRPAQESPGDPFCPEPTVSSPKGVLTLGLS